MSPARILAALLAAMALAAPAAQALPAAERPATPPKQDLRSPDAVDAAREHDAATPPLPGPPSDGERQMRHQVGPWPANPQPITTPAATSDDGAGIDAPTIALGILGSLLAVLAIAGIAERSRRGKHRHAAA
jgi:hypothetical protein